MAGLYNHYLRPWLGLAEGSETKTHYMWDHKGVRGRTIPLSRYIELDEEFLNLKVPIVEYFITENASDVLDPKHKTKLPSNIWWNVVNVSYQEFIRNTTKIWKL